MNEKMYLAPIFKGHFYAQEVVSSSSATWDDKEGEFWEQLERPNDPRKRAMKTKIKGLDIVFWEKSYFEAP